MAKLKRPVRYCQTSQYTYKDNLSERGKRQRAIRILEKNVTECVSTWIKDTSLHLIISTNSRRVVAEVHMETRYN